MGTNNKKLNGIVDVKTEVGQGNTYTIKLPLTQAILTGLIVRSRMDVYIIPLISVVEILKYETELCLLKDRGGQILAQNDESCIVYGMPKTAVSAKLADAVLSVEGIIDSLNTLTSN